MFQNNLTSEFLAVVGRYSALCFGITRTILSYPVVGNLKPPLFALYKNVKSTKTVTVGKDPVGLSYVKKISMSSIPERIPAGRYSVYATAFKRTILSRPEL